MSTHKVCFLSRNKKNIITFRLKKLELWTFEGIPSHLSRYPEAPDKLLQYRENTDIFFLFLLVKYTLKSCSITSI